jgi:hypothetical protein
MLLSAGTAGAQSTSRDNSTRVIEKSAVPIADRLLPSDDVVTVSWKPLVSTPPSGLSKQQRVALAVQTASAVAVVDVDVVSVLPAEGGTWIETILNGRVADVLKQDPAKRVERGAAFRLHVNGGTLSVGNVVVRTEGSRTFPPSRRYLAFFGMLDEISGDWLAGHSPLLVTGKSVASAPSDPPTSLDGVQLSDVAAATVVKY